MINDPGFQEFEFDSLLAEFTERVRQGERPDVTEYLERYPAQAEQINELFPLIMQLEGEKSSSDSSGSGTRWKVPVIEKLGDYLLIREIGRGGMGVVYEARQSSLDRRVALKVLKEDLVDDPKSLARFQREGRMAASLHHANIVPVLGTGSEGGSNYIVMQMVDGVGLDQMIDLMIGDQAKPEDADQARRIAETSMWKMDETEIDWKKFARLAYHVAGALTHAHEQQVIHRDIKPSNLIVDRHGKPWVADFGLARNFDSGDDVSRVAGTPRYMAPEQMVGNATAISDIFSFGLTLYELAGSVRVYELPSGEIEDIRKQKRHPLEPLSHIAVDIPNDLERIVMKCVQVDPEDRYSDAAALTEDLGRFLENRPLASVHVTWFYRAKRWAQRNPSTAIASAIAAMLLFGIAVVSYVGFLNERNQRTKTEETLQVSIDALDKVYDRLAPDVDSSQPLSSENATLLNDLLESYDRLGQLDTTNLELKRTAADANFRVGEIHRRLDHGVSALAAFDRAIEIYRELISRDDEMRPEASLSIVRAMIGQGRIRTPEADLNRSRLQESLDLIEAQLTDDTKLPETVRVDLRFERARALYFLGVAPKRQPVQFGIEPPTDLEGVNAEPTNKSLGRAMNILEQWSAPAPARVTTLLAQCYSERSATFNDEDYRRSIDLQQTLVREFPESNLFRINLVDALSDFDPLKLPTMDYPEAVRSLKKTLYTAGDLDLSDRRVRTIVMHTHYKLALIFGSVHEKPDRFSNKEREWMLGNSTRNALDEAIRSARAAVDVNERKGVEPAGLDPESAGRFGWVLRFRTTLCRLLWERNRGTDRREVTEIIADSQSLIGSINLSTDQGKALSRILQQLVSVSGE